MRPPTREPVPAVNSLVGSGGPSLEFLEWFVDNVNSRLRPEDQAAVDYWTAATKSGVDADKAALEIMRAMTPAYFFDRAKGGSWQHGRS